MANKQKKPSSAAVKTVKTTQKKCLFEYIAVNVISLFVFLSFGYIAVMAFFQTSVIDPTNYAGERILYNSDNIILNLVFTCITVAALFALKKFFDKRIEDDKQIRNLSLACLVPCVNGLPLVVPRREERLAMELQGGVTAGLVVIGDGGGMEGHDDVRVRASFCPPGGYSHVIDAEIRDGELRVPWRFYQKCSVFK